MKLARVDKSLHGHRWWAFSSKRAWADLLSEIRIPKMHLISLISHLHGNSTCKIIPPLQAIYGPVYAL